MIKRLKLIISNSVLITCCIALFIKFNVISIGKAQDYADLVPTYPTISLSDTVNLRPLGVISVVAKEEYSIIQDSGKVLNNFFDRLMEMKKNMGDSVVTVLHIGDSHIQAGYLGGQMMRHLQRDFGNAGRGWIAPLKIAKTNEPNDYFLTSSIKDWSFSRLGRVNENVPLGLGCVAVKTKKKSVNLDIIITPNHGEGYSFNRIDIFRHQDALPLVATTPGTDFMQGTRHKESNTVCDTLLLPNLMDTVSLNSIPQDSMIRDKINNSYYGMSLRNGQKGILYHAVASNGAMFVNYTNPKFIHEMTLLNPDLIIVSLGTNETFGKRFRKTEFKGQVEQMVDLIAESFPETPVMLTTPPETYQRIGGYNKRNYIINKNSFVAASAIKEIAEEKNMACFDLFSAGGGKGAAKMWYDRHWLSRDRIHFTVDGYKHQGDILYRSLIKSWNEYVKDKVDIQAEQKEQQIIYPKNRRK